MPRSFPHVAAAERYAKDVVAGKIPACLWVRLACQRHLSDLKKQKQKKYPYTFDPEKASRVCSFAERMPHVKGKWAGELIRLEPWQKFILCCLFGWVRKKDGRRRFREAYVEVPRKNAKSTIAAVIGNYMFAADGEAGAEVFSGATSEKQAWEVFRPARLMALKSPGYLTKFGIQVNASNMNIPDNASRFEPLIGDPGDGASPSCAIVDEYHEHKTPALHDTMLTGMGAREQPLHLVITTAGISLSSPCYEKRGRVCKILQGLFENEELFAIIYTVDEEDDWTDIGCWKKANPNFGVSVFEDYLAARLKEAVQSAGRQNIIKCKHLNVWSNARTAWMNMQDWNACADPNLKLDDFKGETALVSLDLASRVDIAARVVIFPRRVEDKWHYYAFCQCYLPEEKVFEPQNTHYQGWHADGLIEATEGNEIDFNAIKNGILGHPEDAKRRDGSGLVSRFDIREVVYDPWQATQLAQELTAEGANAVECRATVANFSPAMKEIEGAVMSGRFHHDGNPLFAWMISNVVARVDAKDNIYPRKENAESKIDGAVALIMGIARLLLHQEVNTGSYLDKSELLIL